ncbi:hypothetical protein DFR55_10811 [Herbinix hemicellulosilytica]|uniref:Putative membrane protein n=1 Tax=Herbinix hemicellulosilytica TaxID=1564487 RepID=A0A0H5SUQ1_HERHM|nr:hypothetical protein [Herbinix hemicellulosilytica]RBP58951.1 hypothetical protein DFR55_10811 [Herbinix hemicellulosilytica]CRZ34023.1 putative membrane protein [Herbinix hemicellulosilytica]
MNYNYLLIPLSIVLIIILLYLLWINGYLIISRKTAVLFVGLLRKKGRCKVKFKSCNGNVKRVIKINESKNYIFNLNTNISKGNVTAEIKDKNKRSLLQLDKSNQNATLNLNENERYYLILSFENADGELELTWS